MILVTIHEATGAITSVASFPDVETLQLNIPTGGGFVEGHHDPETLYVKNGALKEYPAKPTPSAMFDFANESWILDDKVIADDLSAARLLSIQRVNDLSGEIRKRHITEIAGQQMLYLRKEAEAKAWVSATNPNIDDYPYIKSEIGITADDAGSVAMVYLNQAYYLDVAASALEVGRLGTIAVIEAADDLEVINQAVDAFVSGVS